MEHLFSVIITLLYVSIFEPLHCTSLGIFSFFMCILQVRHPLKWEGQLRSQLTSSWPNTWLSFQIIFSGQILSLFLVNERWWYVNWFMIYFVWWYVHWFSIYFISLLSLIFWQENLRSKYMNSKHDLTLALCNIFLHYLNGNNLIFELLYFCRSRWHACSH